MSASITLSHAAARAVYDRIGRWQDTQRFYEDHATAELIEHAAFEEATSVVEFGSGTGRIAARLLRDQLPQAARYRAVDISPTMVALAQRRLAPWADRVTVELSDGTPHIAAPDHQIDRFLSTYVLDLLSEEDIAAVLAEAHRLLAPGGRLCLVSATTGRSTAERLVVDAWRRVHALAPGLVGGCRPVELRPFLEPGRWRLLHWNVVSKWAIPSEVIVAVPRADAR